MALCSAPVVAEESVTEKIETIEEYVLISEEVQEKKESLFITQSTFNYNHQLQLPEENSKLIRNDQKLFLLYLSLKLCD